jgi:small subunit ribosomal protein S21
MFSDYQVHQKKYTIESDSIQFLFFGKTNQSLIFAIPKKSITMLIIDSKDCENIDKALKKYKKKFEKAKILLQLRERHAFIKPSIRRRCEVLKAIYKQKIFNGEIEA